MSKYGQFRQHVGQPVEFKPPRDRMVRSKDVVACPECGADVGEYCRRPGPKPSTAAHTARRRMAVRRLNQQKDTD